MTDFEWLPTECADERYPMQLIRGQLRCHGGVSVPVPAGKLVNNGWGEVGSRRLVGSTKKPVPQQLELAWFSYTEDQFFKGTVELSEDELTHKFKSGFPEPLTRKRVTWSKVIVGMGLGGWTCVWLAGSGLVQAVASAQLEPAQLDWALVLDNPKVARADFVRDKLRTRLSKAELEALAKHGPPVASWPELARPFRWRIRVEGIQVPLHMFLRSFNGERHFYDFARRPPEQLERAPKQLQITWLTRSQRKLLTNIRLDQAEVFRAFEDAGAAELDTSSALLRVELGPRSKVSVVLESRAGRIPLTRTSAEVLSLAD